MIPSEYDDEIQDQDSLGIDAGKNGVPRRVYSLRNRIAFWLILQLIFLAVWGDNFWDSGLLWFFFAWLLFGLFAYLSTDSLNAYNRAGAKKEERNLVGLECTHCGAFYSYPESSVDSTDNSVECQNCARRFQFDRWKDVQNY